MNLKEMICSPDEQHISSLETEKAYCVVSDKYIYIGGDYYLYQSHSLKKQNQDVKIPLQNILRVGETKTYSRGWFYATIGMGVLAMLVKLVPRWFSKTLIYYDMPSKIDIWHGMVVICLVLMVIYVLSAKQLLEINTTKGRFCMSKNGVSETEIDELGEKVNALKNYEKRKRGV